MIKTFTLTASPRAEILSKTLKSFNTNLIGVSLLDCTIYANIDPFDFPGCSDRILKVVDVLNKYFGNVIYRVPESPNFAEALKYVWSQPSDELIFHLEDDWELTMPIDLSKIEGYFYSHSKLMQVRLRWERCIKKTTRNPVYGLSPCIVRKEFYQAVASRLVPTKNPEWQIRRWGKRFGLTIPSVRSIFIIPKTYCVKDIGGTWKIGLKICKQKLTKHDSGSFIKWLTKGQKLKEKKEYDKLRKLKFKRLAQANKKLKSGQNNLVD